MSSTPFSGRGDLATSKHYQWQALVSGQWLPVEHDFVIEAHFTQPGAKEMWMSTSYGCMRIDFDLIQKQDVSHGQPLSTRRVCHLPPGQTEDVGWYFKDDHLWQEYGCTMNSIFSSVGSRDIEVLFRQNPQASIRFTVGSTDYTLNFASMDQTNSTTGKTRKVRRRPRFRTNAGSLGAPRWQFFDEDGVWKDYSRDNDQCSVASPDIELHYRRNLQKMTFTTRSFHYELHFITMTQKNLSTNTKRRIRRLEQ